MIQVLKGTEMCVPLRRGASQGPDVRAPAAAPHQRAPLQHPVHHHHPGHADGRSLPLLQHQEPQPQVGVWHSSGSRRAGGGLGEGCVAELDKINGRCSRKVNEGPAFGEMEERDE